MAIKNQFDITDSRKQTFLILTTFTIHKHI